MKKIIFLVIMLLNITLYSQTTFNKIQIVSNHTEESMTLKVYPNPVVNEDIKIETSSKELNTAYLYDTKGVLIRSILFRDSIKFTIQNPGLYYLKIGNIVRKIIKL